MRNCRSGFSRRASRPSLSNSQKSLNFVLGTGFLVVKGIEALDLIDEHQGRLALQSP